MARIAGREVPNNKAVWIGLTYIYGIGRYSALKIVEAAKIDKSQKIGELSEDELNRIREQIDLGFKVEGDLRTERSMNIKRLIDIGAYRGIRHKKRLPVRGQRTRTNARSWKGARANAIKKK
ncbi:MAG: 30S ribosomal protein S13 [Brevinemataceae bacterium]